MTLQMARDIGGIPNRFAKVVEHLEAFTTPVGHVVDGIYNAVDLSKDELSGIACGITACSCIYVCEPHGSHAVAGFLLNEPLRHARLAFLIDNEPATDAISAATAANLCGYINQLFKDDEGVDSVGIPGDHAIEPMPGQSVDRGTTTVVSLSDTENRPRPSED